ncbi:unnamed protein product [Onchocerca flexuosa]|uniref:LysM domain-containing protein n=1 Tax=Onchocerca flexuosa TaxID=387005 RepID=A0A183HRK8_9BILA|nr:unnamed protein product [Onchocerca flexuosa]
MIFVRHSCRSLRKNAVVGFCFRKFADGSVQQALEINDKWNEVEKRNISAGDSISDLVAFNEKRDFASKEANTTERSVSY